MLGEDELIERLRVAKRVFLLEPPYKRKYPPLGLAKMATFVRQHDGEVVFGREYEGQECDLVCTTSLFTYDSAKVVSALRKVRSLAPRTPILVGGIYASLTPEHLTAAVGDVDVFLGYSRELDLHPPDYSLDWGVAAPWDSFSYVFTTRGCPNHCPYCAVPRLEPALWVNPEWQRHIVKGRSNVMVSDNNLSAAPAEHLAELISFLESSRVRVLFDNGFDCKFITPEMAHELARLRYTRHGMRLAFDRIEEDGTFQNAVKCLINAGVPKGQIMAYVLFNFNDSPAEANYRMRECVNLGIRPYPQQFTPLNATDRLQPFIGKFWTKRLARAFRFFWLMAGFHTKWEFSDWLRVDGAERFALDDGDWQAWGAQG